MTDQARPDPAERLFRSEVEAGDGDRYLRIVIRTPWWKEGDDLAAIFREHAAPISDAGDTFLVGEKALSVLRGNVVPAEDLRPGKLARLLSSAVRASSPVGLNVPEKMELTIRIAGAPRVLLAAVLSVLSKPLRISGVFHCVVGGWCRHIDGMTPPYDRQVVRPLMGYEAQQVADRLSGRIGMPVAILDLNDSGGTIRAVSRGLDKQRIFEALSGNPLGQRDRSTPIGLLRRI